MSDDVLVECSRLACPGANLESRTQIMICQIVSSGEAIVVKINQLSQIESNQGEEKDAVDAQKLSVCCRSPPPK